MPVIVAVDHERREVNAVCVGPVTLTDAMSQVEHEAREHGLGYRKFIDARGAGFLMTPDESRQIADSLRALSKAQWIGPAAVVVSSESVFEAAHLVGKLVEGVCEIRAFRDEKEAREWLASRPI